MTITNAQTRDHVEAMRRTARRLVRNPSDAEDIVQEALLRTIVYVRDGRKIENWGGYLSRVVRNVVADDHARRARQGIRVDLDGVQDELRVAPNQIDTRQVRELNTAIGALPKQQSQVIRLVAIEGMSYQATAEKLGVPLGTIMSRLHRGREALRAHLDGDQAPRLQAAVA